MNVFLQIRNVSFHWEAVPTLERSRADGALRATFCYHRDDLMSALLSSLLCLGQPWAGASFQHRLGQEEDGHTRAIKAVKYSCPSENGGLLLTGLGRAGSSLEAPTLLGTMERVCKATQTQRKAEQHWQVLITPQHRNTQISW